MVMVALEKIWMLFKNSSGIQEFSFRKGKCCFSRGKKGTCNRQIVPRTFLPVTPKKQGPAMTKSKPSGVLFYHE